MLFDVLISGTMLCHGIFKIVTFNSDFDIIKKVTDIVNEIDNIIN